MKVGAALVWAGLAATHVLIGCKASPPATVEKGDRPMPIPAMEISRGQDACGAYVKQVCACATLQSEKPAVGNDATAGAAAKALTEQCKLAEGIPDAIALSLDLANGSGVTRRDVLQAQQSVRQMIAECIEQTAMLPTRGCGN